MLPPKIIRSDTLSNVIRIHMPKKKKNKAKFKKCKRDNECNTMRCMGDIKKDEKLKKDKKKKKKKKKKKMSYA